MKEFLSKKRVPRTKIAPHKLLPIAIAMGYQPTEKDWIAHRDALEAFHPGKQPSNDSLTRTERD